MATVTEAPLAAKTKGRILIVDDELVVRDSLGKWFTSEGYAARPVGSAREALETIQKEEFDIALLDIKMPGMDGMELQARLREADPELTVVMMTGYASVDTAVQALKHGAYDYITKPVDPDELSHLVANALEHKRARREVVRLREDLKESSPSLELIGKSPVMKKVVELIEMVAPTEATVLITGESGTGKEVVARAIHAAGPRRYMPMVSIHCGALTETLLESELFGHEKGAFTGATSARRGKFELADGGTLFLDEVGDLHAASQAKLLRVLQEGEFHRVGGEQAIRVSVRVISATNRDLSDMVAQQKFREDLYYRLCVVPVRVPSLRERGDDVRALAEYFLSEFCGRNNFKPKTFQKGVFEALEDYSWPGNIRELRNTVERMAILARGDLIESDSIPVEIRMARASGARGNLREAKESAEREHILKTLEETKWNVSSAARALGMERTNLHKRIRALGLARER